MTAGATSSALEWIPTNRHPLDHVLGLALGTAFTFGIFWSLAHIEQANPAESRPDAEDLHAVSLPFEPPPPKPVDRDLAAEIGVPFSGLEVSASESEVKIAVVPPDLDLLVSASDAPPAVVVSAFQLHSELRPKIELSADFNRVFSQMEVDQKPTVIFRPTPNIPSKVHGNAKTMRVTLLILIDKKGGVTSVRLFKSSGNTEFDTIIIESVRDEWQFSPAIKKGHPVRCLVEQAVSVKWETGGSPFEIR